MSKRLATITFLDAEQELHDASYTPIIKEVDGKATMLQVLKEGLDFTQSYVYEYTLGDTVANDDFASTTFRNSVERKLLKLFGRGRAINFRIWDGSGFSAIPRNYQLQAPTAINEWKVFNGNFNTEVTIRIQ